jgi:metallo-beta-lactamase class B
MTKATENSRYLKPAKIWGNLYFVGTRAVSTHLIDTNDGLMILDPGYAEDLHIVLNNIRELGFQTEDIKYIVSTHWHGDHTEATAGFVALSGAKTLIGERDAEKARRYFEPDILIRDGDTLSLGNVTMHFVHTPGHTAGTMSFFYETEENGVKLRVGTFGGAGLNTLVPEKYDFEGAREAYFASLARLREEKVDVYLGNHTWNNDTYRKSKAFKEGPNPFINSKLFATVLDYYKERLEALIRKEAAEYK